MTTKVANVVSINAKQPMNASERAKLARLPAPVHQVQEKAKNLFQKALRSLFDNADDALFELADRATNNADQNAFFESMREVRICRRDLELKFASALEDAFVVLIQPQSVQSENYFGDAAISASSLTLVGDDELEELVAVESMISRANEACGENLQYLALRMDSLVPIKVYQKNNPVGPEVVCRAFVETTRKLKIDIKAKLVLFKLFDRYVVNGMPQIYAQLNAVLIEANVMPSLQRQRDQTQGHPGQPLRRRASDTSAQDNTGAVQSQAPAYSGSYQTRGHQNAGGQASNYSAGYADRAGEGASYGGAPVGGNGVGNAAGVLLGALTQMQNQQTAANQPVVVGGGPIGLTDISAILNSMLPGRAQVADHQADAINLVKMLFEFILDDRNLANPMKALISRLQIPILKVAILDQTFFSKSGHPARRLLNEMATASLGWQEDPTALANKEPTDQLYRKIHSIVHRLLSEFETDVAIFGELLTDFVSFIEKERRRASLLEQRIIDAEDGRARAESARETAAKALNEKIHGRTLPSEIEEILNNAWSNVLFFVCLKEGTDSESWHDALRTAEELIWSATTPLDAATRKTLLSMIPTLVKSLRLGLEKISFNPFELTKLLGSLEKLHLSRLKAHQEAAAKAKAEQLQEQRNSKPAMDVLEAAPAATKPALLKSATEAKAASAAAPQLVAVAPKPAAKAAAATANPSEAARTSASPEEQFEANLDIDETYLALVSKLTQGTWFEMADANQRHFRCRLAAIIKATGKYIFVNRGGMKVAEKTREELAVCLRSGDLRVLDDTMLFDRALESVIGGLRKPRQQQ